MLRKIAVGLAALGALNAAQVKALGLGDVTVHSALNQPLNAEIDLLQIRDLTSSQIVAGLAEADEFYLAGVKPTAILSDLSFELDLSSGSGRLLLKTREPIREPFLNFLVEVNWPTGRLVKEYTLLLDPPVFSAQDLSPQAAPVAPVVQAAKPAPFTVARPQVGAAPATVPVAPVAATGDGSYFVGDKDTLWNIALKTRPSRSITPQQMMLAIQRANPDAFINNNINRLRSGVVLDIPTRAEIDAMALGNPVSEVQRQNSAWRSGAGGDAPETKPKSEQLDATAPAAAVAEAPAQEESQLRIVSKEPAEAEPAADQTLSSDTTAGEPSGVEQELLSKNRELEEQLVVTLEGLDKVERDNAELFSRLERITEQMESMQRLIELKDQQLADLQNRSAQPEQAAPAPTPAPQPQPSAPTGNVVDTLMKSPATLGGIGAGLLALLGGLLWFVRKRREDNEAEELAVAEAMAVLDAQEQGEQPQAAGVAAVAAEQAVEALAEVDESSVDVDEDPNDPFNAISEADVNEFAGLGEGGDLDMDLKIDEPVANDLDLDQFSESLLSDDDFDLAVDDESMRDDKVPVASEADDEPLDDLDLVLGGDELADEGAVEPEADVAEEALSVEAAEEVEADNLDSELEAILGASEPEAADAAEEMDSLEDDLDAILAEEAAEDEVEGAAADELDAIEGLIEPVEEVSEPDVAEVASDALDGDIDALLADSDDEEVDELDRLIAEHAGESAGEEPESVTVEEDAALSLEDEALSLADDDALSLDSEESQSLETESLEGLQSDDALQVDGEEDLESLSIESVAPVVEDEEPVGDESLEALLAAHEDEDESAADGELDLDALSALALDEESEAGSDEAVAEEAAADEAVSDITALAEADLDEDLKVGELLDEEPEAESEEPEISLELAEESDESDPVVDSLLAGLPEAEEGEAGLSELESELAPELVEQPEPAEEVVLAAAAGEGLSELVLDENLDAAADEDLEAELNLMLEQEGNELALDESGVDEALDYLEDADEVGTKLDLARAYVDMDDREGAADILAEVVKEGSDEQVAEAKRMLDSLHAL